MGDCEGGGSGDTGTTEHDSNPFLQIRSRRYFINSLPPAKRHAAMIEIFLNYVPGGQQAKDKSLGEKEAVVFRGLLGFINDAASQNTVQMLLGSLVEVAGTNFISRVEADYYGSINLFLSLLPCHGDEHEFARVDAAMQIFENNPKLFNQASFVSLLEHSITSLDSRQGTDEFWSKAAKFLGKPSTPDAVEFLTKLIRNDRAVPQAVEALGEIGHNHPEAAAFALNTVLANMSRSASKPGHDDHSLYLKANAALDKIADRLVENCDFSVSDKSSKTFSSVLGSALKLLGVQGQPVAWLSDTISDQNIISLKELVRVEIRKPRPWHPFEAREARSFLNALKKMPFPSHPQVQRACKYADARPVASK